MLVLNTLLSTREKLAFPSMVFPAKIYFFLRSITEFGHCKPWDIILCKQSSTATKDQLAHVATKIVPYYTLLTDLSLAEESLWESIARSRRLKISQAEKMNIEIRVNPYPTEHSYARVKRFHLAKGLPAPEWAFFKSLARQCDTFTIALHGEEALLHMVVKDTPARAMVMYSCVLNDHLSNSERGALNSYLHWWEVKHYRDLRYQQYDWGGVVIDKSSPLYSITRFKREFGGELAQEWHLVVLGSWLRPLGRLARWRSEF
jgi:hypothetical protein